jgi:DNA polymerase III epsilon subunit-like protein
VLDTVALARHVLGEEEVADCKLSTLAAHFNTRIKPRHRALPDALATADVLTALLRRLAATGVRTLAEAVCINSEGGATQPQVEPSAQPKPSNAESGLRAP